MAIQTDTPKFARLSAAAGVVVWLLLLLTTTSDLRETEVIHKVVFFGMLVVVPLGLSLIPASEQPGSSLYRLAVLVQPVAALPAIASFYFETGPVAAVTLVRVVHPQRSYRALWVDEVQVARALSCRGVGHRCGFGVFDSSWCVADCLPPWRSAFRLW